MKHLRILLLVLICCFVTAWAMQEAPKPSKVEQRMFSVKGDQPWTNTQLRIRPQDRVTLTASGQVRFSKGDALSSVGPDGYAGEHGPYNDAWPGDYLQCDDPLPDANHAALIVEVNNEVFVAGTRKIFTGKEGILVLGINDCSFTQEQVFYNTGQFQVIVKIERGAFKKK